MNKNFVIAGIVGLVVIVGIVFFAMQGNTSPSSTTNQETSTQVNESANTTTQEIPTTAEATTGSLMQKEATEGAVDANVKTFTVEGSNFSFSLKEMKVKKGDTVKVTFTNKDGMHNWMLDEFNAKTKTIPAGESETVQFVADKAGTFEYYCSVGQHRKNGMFGKLIVE